MGMQGEGMPTIRALTQQPAVGQNRVAARSALQRHACTYVPFLQFAKPNADTINDDVQPPSAHLTLPNKCKKWLLYSAACQHPDDQKSGIEIPPIVT